MPDAGCLTGYIKIEGTGTLVRIVLSSKAIPNKLVDSHPIFDTKIGAGGCFLFFYFHQVTGRLEIDKLFSISIFAIAE